MPIPDFQSVMLPLLQRLEDGREHSNQETLDALAQHFRLTAQEREELLPSGRQAVFTNRVAWAKSHLKGAGLLGSPRRGFYQLTKRGAEAVTQNLTAINLRYLQQYPEYLKFRHPRKNDEKSNPALTLTDSLAADDMTPEEHLEYGHQRIQDQLAADILSRIRECSSHSLRSWSSNC